MIPRDLEELIIFSIYDYSLLFNGFSANNEEREHQINNSIIEFFLIVWSFSIDVFFNICLITETINSRLTISLFHATMKIYFILLSLRILLEFFQHASLTLRVFFFWNKKVLMTIIGVNQWTSNFFCSMNAKSTWWKYISEDIKEILHYRKGK